MLSVFAQTPVTINKFRFDFGGSSDSTYTYKYNYPFPSSLLGTYSISSFFPDSFFSEKNHRVVFDSLAEAENYLFSCVPYRTIGSQSYSRMTGTDYRYYLHHIPSIFAFVEFVESIFDSYTITQRFVYIINSSPIARLPFSPYLDYPTYFEYSDVTCSYT